MFNVVAARGRFEGDIRGARGVGLPRALGRGSTVKSRACRLCRAIFYCCDVCFGSIGSILGLGVNAQFIQGPPRMKLSDWLNLKFYRHMTVT